jgi:NitT/TauT family transport system substrate-binding protein
MDTIARFRSTSSPYAHRGAATKRSLLTRLALVLFALSCLAGSIAPPAAAQSAQVTVGITRTATDVGWFIADKKGYFRDQGIEVKLISFASAAQMIVPLGSGQLDVGGGTVAAGLYNAIGRGIGLKVVADKGSIADKYEYSTLLVRKDLVDSGRYHGLSDLKGMKIATAAQGAGSESSMNEALKKGGLSYGDVEVVYLGFPEHLIAYRNKAIDASITAEPATTRTLREGLAVRGSNTVIYPGQQTAVVLYSADFIARRREVAEKFMYAYIKALRDYNDALVDGKLAGPNAAEIISILTEYTAIKDPEIYRAMTPFAVNPDGLVNLSTLKNDLEFFRQRKYLVKDTVDLEKVVDYSFAHTAVERLGPYRKPSP